MAIQKGIVKLSGKLGDLIFYSRNQKQAVRSSTCDYHLSEASRQSGKDFGEASKNAAYVRKAFAPLISKYSTGNLVNRMNKLFMQIFKNMPKSLRGNKRLIDGNISLLKGFEFNSTARFDQFVFCKPQVQLHTDSALIIDLKAGEAEQLFSLKVPQAKAIGIDVMVLVFDLNGDEYQVYKGNTLKIDLLHSFTGAKLKVDLLITGEQALLVALGVHFYTAQFSIDNRKYFAAQIVESWHLRDGQIFTFIERDENEIESSLADNEEDTGLSWVVG